MNKITNIRIFTTSLVFLAAITFSAAPAQAGHRSHSYQQSHRGFTVSFSSPNYYYGYGGHYQPSPRFHLRYRSHYRSPYGRHYSYRNGHHQRRGHVSRGHYRGHSSRARRGRGHHRRHH